MQHKHVEMLDNLLRNAMEERIYEAAFAEFLKTMSDADRDELPAVLISRYEILSDRMEMGLPIPTLATVQAFIHRRQLFIADEQLDIALAKAQEEALDELDALDALAFETRVGGLS